MQRNRFWIEIVALGTMIACALALLIATLGAGAAAFTAQDTSSAPPQTPPAQAVPQKAVPQKNDDPAHTYEGMITCSHCGAQHQAQLHGSAASCTLACVHGGAAFALVDGEKVYQLTGDANLLKKFAGERVKVTGIAHGSAIEVSMIASS